MGENSKIEWTTHTFNPWHGCDEATLPDGLEKHPGCDHCYAKAMAKRNPGTLGQWGGFDEGGTRVVASEATWKAPLKWNKATEQAQRDYSDHAHRVAADRSIPLGPAPPRPRVFCASIADIFEDWRGPIKHSAGPWMWKMHEANGHPEQWGAGYVLDDPTAGRALTMADLRARLFRLIDATPYLDWLLLTKRPQNVPRMWPDYFPGGYLAEAGEMNQPGPRSNVWIGTSISDQATADALVPELLKCRYLAPVLFLSAEPLLGPIVLDTLAKGGPPRYLTREVDHPLDASIDWLIAGGESGAHARPMHPDWVRGIRDQCVAAGVPFHFKQWGEWIEGDAEPGGDLGGDMRRGNAAIVHREPHSPEELCKQSFFRGDKIMRKVVKKAAGRLLDGRTWDDFPVVRHA